MSDLKLQKRLAAQAMDCSPKRVAFDTTQLERIKEAITKTDIKSLIKNGVIIIKPIQGISRARARKIMVQKRKGLQKGHGSRKGTKKARLPKKTVWQNKVRVMRRLLKVMRDKKILPTSTYRSLYLKVKGGFFRSKRHLKGYIGDHDLAQQKQLKK